MKELNRIIEKGISAIIPVYQDKSGNCTEIITNGDESYIILKTIRTILRLLCKFYGVDIYAVREKYSKVVNQRTAVPIPLGRDIILLPYKMRKPMFLKDGAYGYVNIFSIEDIYCGDATYIKLKNNKTIKVLTSLKTALEHYNKGKLVLNDPAFKSQYNPLGGSSPYSYIYKELNSPATKGDIVILREEIMAIRESLKGNKKII